MVFYAASLFTTLVKSANSCGTVSLFIAFGFDKKAIFYYNSVDSIAKLGYLWECSYRNFDHVFHSNYDSDTLCICRWHTIIELDGLTSFLSAQFRSSTEPVALSAQGTCHGKHHVGRYL